MADEAKRPIIIIKKKAGHGGHHGGAWKVAYADFVTAMMALFIVLWLMSASQQTKEAIAGYFRDPLGQGKQMGTLIRGTEKTTASALKNIALAKRPKDLKDLKEELKAAMKMIPNFDKAKAHVEFTLTEEGLRIELMEDSKGMFFESGKPAPSDMGKQVLVVLAKELGKLPNKVLLEGHTDSQPYGSPTYSNWELSADRANEARKLISSSGVAPDQIAEIRGYADQQLKHPDNPADPSNRRVSVIVKYLEKAPEIKLSGSAKVNENPPQTTQKAGTDAASGKVEKASAQASSASVPASTQKESHKGA
jgi:chemotaxis protein MotB